MLLLIGNQQQLKYRAYDHERNTTRKKASESKTVKQLLVQSHRGGGLLTPENTIESFIETWELGAVPEADLRTTSDGVIVAFHDKNFARVVKDVHSGLREKGVQDVTFQELSALDVGSWKGDKFANQRVSRLAEILTLMRGHSNRMLYMDIKDVQLPQLADLVREFEVAEQVILAAPDEQLLRDWRKLVPHGQTLLWMGILYKGDEGTLKQHVERLRDENFAGLTQLQIHVQAIRSDGDWQFKPSLELLRTIAGELKSSGILFQSLPWECADAEVYHMLLGAGVQSFASDYPEVALHVLHEWAKIHPRSD
jgi:glycerophosphoryl diester phosphodiesterase